VATPGLTRLPHLLERHQPAIVILELGGNDGLRGLPVEVTRGNLASMIGQSRAAGARVILAEMRIPEPGQTYTEGLTAYGNCQPRRRVCRRSCRTSR
jgi:acyl-CoA thioesterase-1